MWTNQSVIPLFSIFFAGFLHQVALGNCEEVKRIVSDRSQLVNFRDYDRRSELYSGPGVVYFSCCKTF